MVTMMAPSEALLIGMEPEVLFSCSHFVLYSLILVVLLKPLRCGSSKSFSFFLRSASLLRGIGLFLF